MHAMCLRRRAAFSEYAVNCDQASVSPRPWPIAYTSICGCQPRPRFGETGPGSSVTREVDDSRESSPEFTSRGPLKGTIKHGRI